MTTRAAGRRRRVARLAPGRVEVVRGGLDLGRARVDAAVGRAGRRTRRRARARRRLARPRRARRRAASRPARALEPEPVVRDEIVERAGRGELRAAALELGAEPRMDAVRQRVERAQGAPAPSSSRERIAFRNASVNVRPMPIASPTDFICVPSVASAPGNLSKAKRGNLTTT